MVVSGLGYTPVPLRLFVAPKREVPERSRPAHDGERLGERWMSAIPSPPGPDFVAT